MQSQNKREKETIKEDAPKQHNDRKKSHFIDSEQAEIDEHIGELQAWRIRFMLLHSSCHVTSHESNPSHQSDAPQK